MNTSFPILCRVLTLSVLAAGLSSCSLLKNGKYASQWEIQSEVPASLSSGQATAPSEAPLTARQANSNLSGPDPLAVAEAGPLDLPVSENGTLIEVPKPDLAMTGNPYRMSPPEMLSVPSGTPEMDLPPPTGSPDHITTLLPGPPPPVTEEELSAAPQALPPVDGSPPVQSASVPLPPATPEHPAVAPIPASAPVAAAPQAPLPGPVEYAGSAPSIPLLYGKLDLTPFLNFAPEAPLTKTN